MRSNQTQTQQNVGRLSMLPRTAAGFLCLLPVLSSAESSVAGAVARSVHFTATSWEKEALREISSHLRVIKGATAASLGQSGHASLARLRMKARRRNLAKLGSAGIGIKLVTLANGAKPVAIGTAAAARSVGPLARVGRVFALSPLSLALGIPLAASALIVRVHVQSTQSTQSTQAANKYEGGGWPTLAALFLLVVTLILVVVAVKVAAIVATALCTLAARRQPQPTKKAAAAKLPPSERDPAPALASETLARVDSTPTMTMAVPDMLAAVEAAAVRQAAALKEAARRKAKEEQSKEEVTRASIAATTLAWVAKAVATEATEATIPDLPDVPFEPGSPKETKLHDDLTQFIGRHIGVLPTKKEGELPAAAAGSATGERPSVQECAGTGDGETLVTSEASSADRRGQCCCSTSGPSTPPSLLACAAESGLDWTGLD